jgi:oligopeptide/dipeptide ABC transporter ATP-binding protein
MSGEELLLEVQGLTVEFPLPSGPVRAANEVAFEVRAGETLGIVGESGSGKSVTLRALMGLVPKPGRVVSGSARLHGRDLLALRDRELRDVRGHDLAMIFQDPMTSLNPVLTVGSQLVETLRVRRGMSKSAARAQGRELLGRVGIPSPDRRMHEYPHQLSGGMRQRVMIALAVACEPSILLADEPTTALDATVQDQILELLRSLQEELGMAMILVSHDFGVIAQACDLVAVMYAGSLVEYGRYDEVLGQPRHPYTRALQDSVRDIGDPHVRGSRLKTIGGHPPNLADIGPGCAFAERCPHAAPPCRAGTMRLDRPLSEHGSACIRVLDLV